MTAFKVVTMDGAEHELTASDGSTLMEAIRDNGIDEMMAICGGTLSCATCHVFVDEQWLSKLPAMSEEENELLDGADSRQGNSRLSCQIVLADDLENIRVAVAPA